MTKTTPAIFVANANQVIANRNKQTFLPSKIKSIPWTDELISVIGIAWDIG